MFAIRTSNDSQAPRCRVTNIFVIGEGTKPWISLPKGKGTKLTIAEERDLRRKQRLAESS
jgi:small subunit ribosomal protein S4e